jgi:hypothetical protein
VALNRVRNILLELSYEVYKDQDKAEKICEKHGWDVKYLKQLTRATRQAFRAAKKHR